MVCVDCVSLLLLLLLLFLGFFPVCLFVFQRENERAWHWMGGELGKTWKELGRGKPRPEFYSMGKKSIEKIKNDNNFRFHFIFQKTKVDMFSGSDTSASSESSNTLLWLSMILELTI